MYEKSERSALTSEDVIINFSTYSKAKKYAL